MAMNSPAMGRRGASPKRRASWVRDDGHRLTPSEAGILNGFPADYPWQDPRSKQFLQIADVVAPPVATAVLRSAAGTRPDTASDPAAPAARLNRGPLAFDGTLSDVRARIRLMTHATAPAPDVPPPHPRIRRLR